MYSLVVILCKYKGLTNKAFNVIWKYNNDYNFGLFMNDKIINELSKFVPALGITEMINFILYFHADFVINTWLEIACKKFNTEVFLIITNSSY